MDVDEAWRLQRQWSVVATKTADDLNRWRSINLGLIVFGALLGALAAQNQWFPRTTTVVLGAVGAAALAAAGIIQARLLTADRIRARVATRAASEALKGIVYQYLAGVEPFSGSDRNANLAVKVSEVERLAADHASLVAGATPDARAVPHVNGVADYVGKRAEDQRKWHEQRTAKHKAQARYWRTAELIATGAAAVLAAVGRCLAWAEPVRLGRCCHDGRCCVCRPSRQPAT